MAAVIQVEGLSKKFALRHLRPERYATLRDTIATTFSARGKDNGATAEDFWALKDVSFDVQAGERLGILGRNGAGKSTLLRILSRVTAPTAGRIRIAGRIGSLLEVGTGFHPELTGRENIYLNGVILGMTRSEVESRFDAIVDFAEIEQFLDTPVKRYSSGMYVRLAFAVAAHLDPEILVIDEVLAVGDIAFQRKCLARLGEVKGEARTVIFVSHNLEAVSRLCTRGLMLADGRVAHQGPVAEVIDRYRERMLSGAPRHAGNQSGTRGASIDSVWCATPQGERTGQVGRMDRLVLHLEASLDPRFQSGAELTVGFGIDTAAGARLVTCVSEWQEKKCRTDGPKLFATCAIDFVPFVPGTYLVTAALMHQADMLHLAEHCASFEVVERGPGYFPNRRAEHGVVDVPFHFEFPRG